MWLDINPEWTSSTSPAPVNDDWSNALEQSNV